MVKKIDFIDKIRSETSHFVEDVFSVAKGWYGKTVRYLKNGNESFVIKQPVLAGLSVIGANILLFQMAYRIANFFGENNKIHKTGPGRYTGSLGPAFGLMYLGGIYFIHITIRTSFNPIQLLALHATGLILGAVFAHAMDNL